MLIFPRIERVCPRTRYAPFASRAMPDVGMWGSKSAETGAHVMLRPGEGLEDGAASVASEVAGGGADEADGSGVEDGDAPVSQPTTNAAVRSNVNIVQGRDTWDLCIRLLDAVPRCLLPIGGPAIIPRRRCRRIDR
jgi:hypothetical protein